MLKDTDAKRPDRRINHVPEGSAYGSHCIANGLFDELFGKEENKQTALLYLSSLTEHTDSAQDLQVGLRQARLLQAYLETHTIPNKDFFVRITEDILRILSEEQQTYQGGML